MILLAAALCMAPPVMPNRLTQAETFCAICWKQERIFEDGQADLRRRNLPRDASSTFDDRMRRCYDFYAARLRP